MKNIDVNYITSLVIGKNIEIISISKVLDTRGVDTIPDGLYGVYVITIYDKRQYVGKSSKGEIGIVGRLQRHCCETWHKKIIECIDVIVTKSGDQASLLELILWEDLKPELNSVRPGSEYSPKRWVPVTVVKKETKIITSVEELDRIFGDIENKEQ